MDIKLLGLAIVVAACGTANAMPINFNDFTLQGVSGQDSGGVATIEDGGATLKLDGNTWKYIEFTNGELTNITSDTVINFEYRSDKQGEIHGIMLGSNVNSNNTFRVYGTQGYGRDFETYTGADEGSYVAFSIPVGQFFDGSSFSRLSFLGDHDNGGKDQVSYYRNVEIIPEPASLMLLGIASVGVLARRSTRR